MEAQDVTPGQLLQALERGREIDGNQVSEYEWELKKREWKKEKEFWMGEMKQNIDIHFPQFNKTHGGVNFSHSDGELFDRDDDDDENFKVTFTEKNLKDEASRLTKKRTEMYPDVKLKIKEMIADCGQNRPARERKRSVVSHRKKKTITHTSRFSPVHQTKAPERGDLIPRKHKIQKLSRVQLWNYLREWDMSSVIQREKMLYEFNKIYKTNESFFDTNEHFAHGGTLVFVRFAAGFQTNFLKRRRVWPFCRAMSFFITSLQSDYYTDEFIRMGAMDYIFETIRSDKHKAIDKKEALVLLVKMMKCRNSIVVKSFLCDNKHLLESLVDSMTMCQDSRLIYWCGELFRVMCVEAVPENLNMIIDFVMRILPCDFNPLIQSMGFKVLQHLVGLVPELALKCVKPLVENFKSQDLDLLIQMAKLCGVILETGVGDELLSALMNSAKGMKLKEKFENGALQAKRRFNIKDHAMQSENNQKLRLKKDKARAKAMKADPYKAQAGALFILNYIMTGNWEILPKLIEKGIFGLALKTLGSCPHWEVQGQGVTMMVFLHETSIDCAISMYIMLPRKIVNYIMEQPDFGLRYFTSPICVQFRKLGRFAMKSWDQWLQKVVTPARLFAEGHDIPAEIRQMSKMAKIVTAISENLEILINEPVMEAFPKSPPPSSEEDEDTSEPDSFFDSSDDERYKVEISDGKNIAFISSRLVEFKRILTDQDYVVSKDRFDVVTEIKQDLLPADKKKDDENELGAMEMALLQDAENKLKKHQILSQEEEMYSTTEETSGNKTEEEYYDYNEDDYAEASFEPPGSGSN